METYTLNRLHDLTCGILQCNYEIFDKIIHYYSTLVGAFNIVWLKSMILTIVSDQSRIAFVMVEEKIPDIITVKHTMQK